MCMPKKKDNIAERGVNLVNTIITDELEWTFRELLKDDYGIDAQLEIIKNNEATGRLIAIQIKSGKSYTKKTKEGYVYYGKLKHLNYWLNYSLPVILIICDLEEKKCYWQHITQDNVELTAKSWKVIVPYNQLLSKNSCQPLKKIADNRSDYERKLDLLVIDKPIMKAIETKKKVILESDEWVNKSSGRGSITIKIIDEDKNIENIELDWPIVFLPNWSYEDIFPKLFPWAEFSIDEEFYEEYDEQNFLLDYGIYDKEDGKYNVFGDFEEYRNLLPKIRPYSCDGEVASYRLIIALNEIGKAFLIIDTYLRS